VTTALFFIYFIKDFDTNKFSAGYWVLIIAWRFFFLLQWVYPTVFMVIFSLVCRFHIMDIDWLGTLLIAKNKTFEQKFDSFVRIDELVQTSARELQIYFIAMVFTLVNICFFFHFMMLLFYQEIMM